VRPSWPEAWDFYKLSTRECKKSSEKPKNKTKINKTKSLCQSPNIIEAEGKLLPKYDNLEEEGNNLDSQNDFLDVEKYAIQTIEKSTHRRKTLNKSKKACHRVAIGWRSTTKRRRKAKSHVLSLNKLRALEGVTRIFSSIPNKDTCSWPYYILSRPCQERQAQWRWR